MTAPALDDVGAACRWWRGYYGGDYACPYCPAALRAQDVDQHLSSKHPSEGNVE